MTGDRKPDGNRPAWVLACSVVVVVGTIGALDFLERGPSLRPEAPAGRTPSAADVKAIPQVAERPGEIHEDLHQYALAIEAALVSSDPQRRETAFNTLLPELLANAPAEAVQMMSRQQPGEPRDALRDQMARHWVMLDRESALTWLETLDDPDERRSAAIASMHALAARSPEQAIAAADRFGVGRDDGSLEHIVQIWAETDPAAALSWAKRQSTDARNASLRARIEQVAAHVSEVRQQH
jgi:hypothetical protein